MDAKISRIRSLMAENQLDGLLVLIAENRRYLSGFTPEDHAFDESAGALLITSQSLVLATDSRFELQARSEAPLYEVVIYRNGLAPTLAELADRFHLVRIGFESARVSVQQHAAFQSALEHATQPVHLVSLSDFVERLRVIKSPTEIENTRRALAIAETAFCKVVYQLQPGMTEKHIAWALEQAMREAGADGLSFPVIVAGGPNSALPHATPSDRPIRAGEPILFDWGARWNGYCSDTSRTIALGPTDEMFKRVHGTVLAAQQKAISAIRSGVNGKAVDAIARDHIHQSGYEGKFGHGLGHGTGLAVHEGPRLSPIRETVLRSGMVVTVEPGIYLSGWGGVRIENQVMVGDEGPVVLNALDTGYDVRLFRDPVSTRGRR